MTIHLKTPDLTELKPRIAVIGVGGAGGNAVNNMIAAKLQGVSFIAANTDAQALINSTAETKIQLGAAMTEGLGAGSRPEIGAAAAEESVEEIRSRLKGLHMVFITAGMGGGTGTGAAPVIAAAARAEGVLTVGVVTKPFSFEGQRRMRSAEFGIDLLAEQVDTLIVIPNQNLFRIAQVKTTFSEAFAMADQVLHDGISCITDVMVKDGIINLDFADVNLVMRGMGQAMMGTGEANGENRGREAAEAAISNPLLDDVTLQGAKGLLVSIIGGSNDLTLYEVDEAANRVREEVMSDANIIIGTAFDETLGGSIRVSVVATGLEQNAGSNAKVRPAAQPAAQQVPSPQVPAAPILAATGKAPAKASGESLASRLDQAGASDVSLEQIQEKVAAEPLMAPVQTVLSSQAVSAGTGSVDSQSVRMPQVEDFPPVGQALLRASHQNDQVQNGNARAGLENLKQKAGFFERLAGLAGAGSRSREEAAPSVALQPQGTGQLPAQHDMQSSAYMDPHVKGGALSAHPQAAPLSSSKNDDVSEIPSFLRNYN